MARNAHQVLDDLDWLGEDNLLFISDNANENAPDETGRANGLTHTTNTAVATAVATAAVLGLDVAADAPVDTPGAPDLSDPPPDTGPFLSFEISGAFLRNHSLEPSFAKPEGSPGGGSGGGGKPPKEDDPVDTPYVSPELLWSVILGEGVAGGTTDYYNITIEFYGDEMLWGATFNEETGDYSGGFIDAFLGSAQFLTSMIKYGYAESDYYGPYPDIEAGEAVSKEAEDLVIEAYLSDIDGVGGILGRAGPYDLPDADGDDIYEGFPTAGLMEFDTADAGNLFDGSELGGLWNDTVLHEMMHVVGFGTLWDQATEGGDVFGWDTLVGDTLYYTNGETRRPMDRNYLYTYEGEEANRQAEGDPVVFLSDGSYRLAVEADGGDGTARGHWDEVMYGNEIMTGYINSLDNGVNAGANYLADFTVAAFADLGYTLDTGTGSTVDYDAIAASGSYYLATGIFVDWSDFMVFDVA